MRRGQLALFLLPLLAFTPACDTEESTTDDFRALPGDLEVDLSLIAADGGDNDGTVIWEILKVGAVSDGPVENNVLLLEIQGNEIYDANGNLTCTIKAPYLFNSLRLVTDADSDSVIFTVWDNYILMGQVDLSKGTTTSAFRRLFVERLLFTFSANEIYLGTPSSGQKLMVSTTNLEIQTDERKLLIGALIEGQCGSAGLPGYAF